MVPVSEKRTIDTGRTSSPPFCLRSFSIACRSLATFMTEVLTSSTSKITSTGGSAVAAVRSTARKDTIFCWSLLSRSVKSCCCKPEIDCPALLATTTSSVIWRFVGSTGRDAGGAPFCWANTGNKGNKNRKIQIQYRVLMPSHPKFSLLLQALWALLVNHRHFACGP